MSDDRAVSPVIGVILMVAVTVILAAVIGTFVLDYGQGVAGEVPQATFSFDSNSTHVTATMTGGDRITNATTGSLIVTNGTNPGEFDLPVSAGSSASTEIASEDTVRVVWTGNDGDSHVLAEFQVP